MPGPHAASPLHNICATLQQVDFRLRFVVAAQSFQNYTNSAVPAVPTASSDDRTRRRQSRWFDKYKHGENEMVQHSQHAASPLRLCVAALAAGLLCSAAS